VLCASNINLAIKYLGAQDSSLIQDFLKEVSETEGFGDALEALKQELFSPLLGYGNWRAIQKSKFCESVQSEETSRAKFGQLINVGSEICHVIDREVAYQGLDNWKSTWSESHKRFVISGEEGDGKTWAVAAWLNKQIEQELEFIPPLFLASRDVTSIEPIELFSGALSYQFPAWGKEEWKKRLNRWINSEPGDNPLFVLVLDGINERYGPTRWRDLLEKLNEDKWKRHVAILVTCRKTYWEKNFASLDHLNFESYELPPYTDQELEQALVKCNLTYSEIRDLLPLVRKPRYFDLAVKYRQRIKDTGDVTIPRLIYEDWRDRIQRKNNANISLDDQSFQSFIADLAKKSLERPGQTFLKEGEIYQELPSSLQPQDSNLIFEELRTGGILQQTHRGYQVNSKMLVYGFGLILAYEVEDEAKNPDSNLNEVIAKILEPHPEIDLKAEICEFAALHVLKLADYHQEAKVALLHAWIGSQNVPENVEKSFIAYLPCDPKSYLELAEVIWCDAHNNPWGQELLKQAILRWQKSQKVIDEVRLAFETWLGFINVDGFPAQREAYQKQGEKIQDRILSRLGHPLELGDSIPVGDFIFHPVVNDSIMRLGRFALAIISHLPRQQFVHAITTGIFAEVLIGWPNKDDLFSWCLQSSAEPLWPEIERELNDLLKIDTESSRKAALQLLAKEGGKEAWKCKESIQHEISEFESSLDPCLNHWYSWDEDICAKCIENKELPSQYIAQRLPELSLNPDWEIPDNVRTRLESLTKSIDVQQVALQVHRDSEDHILNDIEAGICSCYPEKMAELIRLLVRQVENREGMPLRQLGFLLYKHSLIFSHAEHQAIYKAWKRLVVMPTPWSEEQELSECLLFKEILRVKTALEQLKLFVNRPEEARDLIQYLEVFKPLSKANLASQHLDINNQSEETIRRTLWFLSANPKSQGYFILNSSLSVFRLKPARR
jgi:hypothetical protein